MNTIVACVFPETLPDEALIFPLVPVFDRLVYLQAIEDEPLDQGIETPWIAQLLRQGTLQRLTPMPLGDQRARFLALVADIKNRRDDYTSQLSMLALAGLSRRHEEESKNSIIAQLLRTGGIDRLQEEEDQVLWQSRLILKLGEFLAVEQADLDRSLRRITSRQDALLAALREEDDTLFAPALAGPATGLDTEAILQHRLKAWIRLAASGPLSAEPQVFITRHAAAFDRLQEVYTSHHGRAPQMLARLELPAHRSPAAETEETAEPCPGLQAALTTLATLVDPAGRSLPLGAGARDALTEGLAAWSHHLDKGYPAATYGRCRLELSLFAEISSRQLFQESSTGEKRPGQQRPPVPATGVLVGLLTQD